MKRREFLKASTLATTALASTPFAVAAKGDEPKIKAYRDLGRTGLKMSDIGIGPGNVPPSSIIRRVIRYGH